MRVEKIMSKTVVTVKMDDSLSAVKEIFDNVHFHHLLVVESEKLVGVISDRDLLKAISPHIGTIRETSEDLSTLNKRVHQIMTRQLVVLGQNARIFDAIKIFNNKKISCIPVVDDGFKPIGMISWRDILKALESTQCNHPNNANQQGRL